MQRFWRRPPGALISAGLVVLLLAVASVPIAAVHEFLPGGPDFPAHPAAQVPANLPQAAVEAFSLDDIGTTEIDDALSVTGLGSGEVVFGVHIAAPGLAITPDSAVDKVARERLSTVYMPGWKLTMLPDEVVQAYTLIEGRDCPAVSIYFTMDEASFEITARETRLERVHIASNLRHDKLDGIVTDATLSGEAPATYAFAPELAFTWRLAKHLKAQREVVRGKPENFNRPDYNFRLAGERSEAPNGTESVEITVRARGSSLDLIVADATALFSMREPSLGLVPDLAGTAPLVAATDAVVLDTSEMDIAAAVAAAVAAVEARRVP